MSKINRDYQYLDAIAGRMIVENAKDTSDGEIYRTLSPCVGGKRLLDMATRLRDSGDLQEAIANTRKPSVSADSAL